ncbi:MAG TPA: DUF423 domain-containing protein [Candidatus Competibacteraceae bacterium]|nr:DUF423 domain-containing protein [Candidatus Competibacteraceae bacterium]
MVRFCLLAGALSAMLGVLLGAFAAHALRQLVPPERLAVFNTGVQYQMYHALGLILVGLALRHWPESAALRWAGPLMLTGIVLFCGSLYALVLSGRGWLGAITPFGGSAFILAWLLVIVGLWRAA